MAGLRSILAPKKNTLLFVSKANATLHRPLTSNFIFSQLFSPSRNGKKAIFFVGENWSRHRGPPQFKSMCGDMHACRAWRTIARSAAKSWNPSGMQNLSHPRKQSKLALIFCPAAKILPTKRPPFLDPKTGAKSPGHKQIKLGLNQWTPFLGAKLLSPSEKSTSFDCFFMYATEFSHTAGFSRAFSHPANIHVHTCS